MGLSLAFLRRWRGLAARWRIWRLSSPHVTIAGDVRIDPGVELDPGVHQGRCGQIDIGRSAVLRRGALLHAWGGRIELAENIFVGPYTVIYGHGGVSIGANALISMQCSIVSSNHTIPDRSQTINSQPDIPLPTRIGADVWLGAGTRVLGNVTIGDGAVVGAGSVVTRDLPAYCVAAGVPARVIRFRS